MFGFKTWEEKQMLADYNRAAADIRELQSLVDKCEDTIHSWQAYAENQYEQLKAKDEYIHVLETELAIRRKNDEAHKKMAVIK